MNNTNKTEWMVDELWKMVQEYKASKAGIKPTEVGPKLEALRDSGAIAYGEPIDDNAVEAFKAGWDARQSLVEGSTSAEWNERELVLSKPVYSRRELETKLHAAEAALKESTDKFVFVESELEQVYKPAYSRHLDHIENLNKRLSAAESELVDLKNLLANIKNCQVGDLIFYHPTKDDETDIVFETVNGLKLQLSAALDVIEAIAPTLHWACEYAKAKDVMNSNWHKSPVKHRELTVDLMRCQELVAKYKSSKGVGVG